jgi:hypothetical protein
VSDALSEKILRNPTVNQLGKDDDSINATPVAMAVCVVIATAGIGQPASED